MDEFIDNAGKGLRLGGMGPQLPQAAPQMMMMPMAAPAMAAAGGAASPGLAAAAGGPIGLAAMGVGSLVGGIIDAAKKRKEAEVKGLQAQAQGAQNLGAAQTGGLQSLMNAYQGILR